MGAYFSLYTYQSHDVDSKGGFFHCNIFQPTYLVASFQVNDDENYKVGVTYMNGWIYTTIMGLW